MRASGEFANGNTEEIVKEKLLLLAKEARVVERYKFERERERDVLLHSQLISLISKPISYTFIYLFNSSRADIVYASRIGNVLLYYSLVNWIKFRVIYNVRN